MTSRTQRYLVTALLCLFASPVLLSQQGQGAQPASPGRLDALRALSTPLIPDARSEEVFDRFDAAIDGTTRFIEVERTEFDLSARRAFFWLADLSRGTYTVLRLTDDPERDALRIYNHLRSIGVDSSLDSILNNLTSASVAVPPRASNEVDITKQLAFFAAGADSANGPNPGEPDAAAGEPVAAQGALYCGAYTVVQAWDPVAIVLTKTEASGYIDPLFQYFSVGTEPCWANPDTGLSSWSIQDCQPYWNLGWEGPYPTTFTVDSFGEYWNWDFGLNGWSTTVWQNATVTWNGSYRGHGWGHTDAGEFSWLIVGVHFEGGYGACG